MARVSTYLNFNGHTEQAFELMGTDAPASMGTDAPASMGFKLSPGDKVPINLEPDSRAEADRLFRPLRHSLDGELQRSPGLSPPR